MSTAPFAMFPSESTAVTMMLFNPSTASVTVAVHLPFKSTVADTPPASTLASGSVQPDKSTEVIAVGDSGGSIKSRQVVSLTICFVIEA